MRLSTLHLNQFKNYESVHLDFTGNVHCFYGNNGAGKTNILDAIYYLSFTRSYFGGSDQLSVRFGDEYFSINGTFNMPSGVVEKVSVALKPGGEKKVKRNDKEYQRLSEHIGAFPVVMITPGDIDLINNASEVRRRFFDSVIAQFDRNYLDDVIRYNKVLLQRNRMLKDMQQSGNNDYQSLAAWNTQLITYGERIFEARRKNLADLLLYHRQMHSRLTARAETCDIQYESAIHQFPMQALLQESFRQDIMAGFTTKGIHRDDYSFIIDENPVRRFGSQGQQKSFLLALKMAQYLLTVEKSGITPVLLFDDVFDKLDPERVGLMIDMVCQTPFGQVFITDTHKMRMEDIIGHRTKIQLFEVAGGEVKAV